MDTSSRSTLRPGLVALLLAGACGPPHDHVAPMDPHRSEPAAEDLRSDPHFYRLNSVLGTVTGDGEPLPDATITVVATGATHPVDEHGGFVLVLDPAELGTSTHELVFAAPGFASARRRVTIPENNQVKLDVALARD